MNKSLSPESSMGLLSSGGLSSFSYGIAITAGILILITSILLASYFYIRFNMVDSRYPPPAGALNPLRITNGRGTQQQPIDIESGLDEATLSSYQKVRYPEYSASFRSGGGKESGISDTCCSICLANYKDSDELRLLPGCGHAFHLKCVDPWLRLHASCPLCRTSPLPTPMATPLAEVVPLATQEG